MTDETYCYKLKIARLAYRDIRAVLDKYENDNLVNIRTHWDGCITVDDEIFHDYQLRDKEE